MENLAGNKNCDVIIQQEMLECGIEKVYVGKTDREVPFSYIGKVNNFIFKRAWRYWIVEGYMPYELAVELYNKWKDLQIRVDGHAGNPHPKEFTTIKNLEDKCRTYTEKVAKNELTLEDFQQKCLKVMEKEPQFISQYHIDTLEGLKKFVEFIKEKNIIG